MNQNTHCAKECLIVLRKNIKGINEDDINKLENMIFSSLENNEDSPVKNILAFLEESKRLIDSDERYDKE